MIINIDSLSPQFDLRNQTAFQHWSESRLSLYPISPVDLTVEITNPNTISPGEQSKITDLCKKYNMAIYSVSPKYGEDKNTAVKLGEAFGLYVLDSHLFSDEDSISSIKVMKTGQSKEFIPYTDRAINWHTDGYYNTYETEVGSMILHCARPSAEGGINSLMDHELMYILLRQENPDFIEALMHDKAMTIPAHYENGVVLREEKSGPVFSIKNGYLHMRYTARNKNIAWYNDPIVQQAKDRLLEICNENTDYVVHHRLEPGQGIICNNVLHKRTAFTDEKDQERLMYRARYYTRIENT